jgi:hypothetical protein
MRRLTAGLATMVASAALLTNAATAQAADGCTYSDPYTPKLTYLWGRKIELRANRSQVCAWGRVSDGNSGDLVWVDRSYDGGRTWQQLSITRIEFGTSNYTEAFNDVGKLMRACGQAWEHFDVACTGWW